MDLPRAQGILFAKENGAPHRGLHLCGFAIELISPLALFADADKAMRRFSHHRDHNKIANFLPCPRVERAFIRRKFSNKLVATMHTASNLRQRAQKGSPAPCIIEAAQ